MLFCTRSISLHVLRSAAPAAALLLLLASPAWSAGFVSFAGLSELPGGADVSFGYGLSADGTVAVGTSQSGNGDEAFRWNAGSMVGIGDLPLGVFDSGARATSSDGSIVVGSGNASTGSQAYRYDHGTTTMTGLGSLLAGGTSSANGVSSDGLSVVGSSDSATGTQAFRWTGSMVGLGDLAGGSDFSQGFAVSADGTSVVGHSSSGNGIEAFLWTLGSGTMTGIGDLSGGGFDSHAYGISPDGTLVVGQGESGSGDEAFLYNGVSMLALGDLSGGTFESTAWDVTDAGTVVGSSISDDGLEAMLWTAAGGMQSLTDLLVAKGLASELAGWTLSEARAISDDGLTIVGYGVNPDGDSEAWIATVPEPTTGVLLALGLIGLAARRQSLG